MSRKATKFSLFSLLLVALATISLASSPAPSPRADDDLICHTSNPNDCYPRVFQPTHEFQPVHDDQDIPNGLHVRMNVWTGEKEAKINVPGEGDASLEGLPVDRGMVVVDEAQQDTDDVPPRIPRGAPAYEAVGKVKEPRHEATSFSQGIKMLKDGKGKNKGQAFDDALEAMEDLSHDMYYGLKIAEDAQVVKALFCMMTDGGSASGSAGDEAVPRGQQAAAILGGSLQNNPPALQEVAKNWGALMDSKCPGAHTPLRQGFYASLMAKNGDAPTDNIRGRASMAKAKVSAINGLLKDDAIRAEFLDNGGMRHLLNVLIAQPESASSKEWSTVQRKIGQLVLDTFLDESMGAKLGQWPRAARLTDAECKAAATAGAGAGADARAEEGCWDYYVEGIMKANKKDKGHWSRELHDRLTAVRKKGPGSGRVEL